MLAFAFFVSIFSTVLWLFYALSYVSGSLNGVSPSTLGILDISIYTAFTVLPIFVVWIIFGYINQYMTNRFFNKNLYTLFGQMKKSQDYTDLMARIMLESEQHIKDGFILGNFDLFISDMNELLSEIIHRTSIASSEQIERLWSKVQNGGKWSFGKVIIEVNNNQPNFKMRVFDKAQNDTVLAGTIMEFSARYLSLVALLEKHDRERVFLNIIETGVLGKVFSIFAPVSDQIKKYRDIPLDKEDNPFKVEEKMHVSSAPIKQKVIIERKEPAVSNSFNAQEISVSEKQNNLPSFSDDDDEDEETLSLNVDERHSSMKKSFVSKMGLFKKKEAKIEKSEPLLKERDPFSMALERSFGNSEPQFDADNQTPTMQAPRIETNETPHMEVPSFGSPIKDSAFDSPFGMNEEKELRVSTFSEPETPRFSEPSVRPIISAKENGEDTSSQGKADFELSHTQRTIDTLKKEWEEMKRGEEIKAPTLSSSSESEEKEEKEETYAYPFGGWTNEDNYHK